MNESTTPAVFSGTPPQTSTITDRPTSASASAAQTRRRTRSLKTNRAQSATSNGAVYWMSSETPISSLAMAAK